MLIILLCEFNKNLVQHMKNSTFTGLSKYIKNVMIHMIGKVLIQIIKSEIKIVPFVAIMLDKLTDIACKSQFNTVLHYI